MALTIRVFCLLLAALCFLLAGVGVGVPRVSFRDFGYFFVTLAFIFG